MSKLIAVFLLLAASLAAQNQDAQPRPSIGYTVANRPVATTAYRTIIVTDGLSAADCTVGGGSTLAFCASTGSVWTPIGGTGTSGTVTTVGFTGGLISVANPTTTPAFTVAGTSGGLPYFSSASTWASSGVLGANLPLFGGGAGASPIAGTRSGNTTAVVTTTGTQTASDCVSIDANGNHVANGAACLSSASLAGVYAVLAGSNAFLAGTANTFTPSATTEAIRLVGTAEPSAPTAGAVNVNTSGSFEWFSTKWLKLTNACAADCTMTMPTTTATIARTDTGQSFSGAQVFAGTVLVAQQTPASAGAACTANQFVFDTGFLYVCTATNTWKRVAVASW